MKQKNIGKINNKIKNKFWRYNYKGGVLVKVGAVEHPMLESHYIEWIEIQTANKMYRKHLNPGDKPEAMFLLEEEILSAREYCNVHGLWKA